MWTDPIIEELHKNREEYAAQFNFDLGAMVKALQEREKVSGRKMISLDSEILHEISASREQTPAQNDRRK